MLDAQRTSPQRYGDSTPTKKHRNEKNRMHEQRRATHYPGQGLTAPVEAFSAYKVLHNRLHALPDAQPVEYDKLVRSPTPGSAKDQSA